VPDAPNRRAHRGGRLQADGSKTARQLSLGRAVANRAAAGFFGSFTLARPTELGKEREVFQYGSAPLRAGPRRIISQDGVLIVMGWGCRPGHDASFCWTDVSLNRLLDSSAALSGFRSFLSSCLLAEPGSPKKIRNERSRPDIDRVLLVLQKFSWNQCPHKLAARWFR